MSNCQPPKILNHDCTNCINFLKTYNFSVGAATQLAVSTTLIDITPSAAVFNPYDRKCWDQDQNEIALDHYSMYLEANHS